MAEALDAEDLLAPPTDRRGFLDALESLRRDHARTADNINAYQCKNCLHCASCIFCEDCEGCYRCNYCRGCADSSNCNHCEGCKSCHTCAHCVECEQCVGSAYLVHCLECADCSYCFGCVGLQKKDFHILNVPYDRSTYFAAVKKLKRELGVSG